MDRQSILDILNRFREGTIGEREALDALKDLPFEDLDYAKIDHHRTLRWGFPEVIFCRGKTPEQVRGIAEKIVARGSNLLATRADRAAFDGLTEILPGARYNPEAGTITLANRDIPPVPGRLTILTAGTSDLPVALEAKETAVMLGIDARLIADVGVAGIHRLMGFRDEISRASVIIVVAGMEGALPSVVAGLVDSPVIAVPTSIGYGSSFNGLSALLGMLNSCAPGLAVMNIDNGFGAAALAFKILRTAAGLRNGDG